MAKVAKLFNGDSLKRFRATRKLSQADVAEKLGIMPQAYYRYECGRAVPSVDVILGMAEAYDVSVDYLLGRSDEPHPPKFDAKTLALLRAMEDKFQPGQVTA